MRLPVNPGTKRIQTLNCLGRQDASKIADIVRRTRQIRYFFGKERSHSEKADDQQNKRRKWPHNHPPDCTHSVERACKEGTSAGALPIELLFLIFYLEDLEAAESYFMPPLEAIAPCFWLICSAI